MFFWLYWLPIKEGQSARLNWTVAAEENNDYFIISRSSNGNDFTQIGTVPSAVMTNGKYVYYDRNPLTGRNFYRLEQVDKDGKKVQSGVRDLVFEKDAIQIIVSPNPVKDVLKVRFTVGVFNAI